jgi:FMN-binding domain
MRIRRSPIVLGATAVGVAFVLAFNTHGQPASLGDTSAVTASTSLSATAGPGGSGSGRSGSGSPGPGPSASASTGSQTVVGADQPNQYGDVQVQVTYTRGQITDVTALNLPTGDSRSQEISAIAGPQLASQAIAAQSASIDGVSGATYTSVGYQASLQSAIDQIALKS